MTNKMIRCGEVLDVRDGTHDSPKYVLEGYPLITSKNIKDRNIEFENINYITQEDFDKINQRSMVDVGDILMPMIGTIGNPVIVNTERPFAIKNVALLKFASDSQLLNKYVYYVLKSPLVIRQLDNNKRGGTQSFVSLSNIRDLKIPNLDIEKQKKIVSVLDKAQELIDKRKEQIEACDELIKSLFYHMFGELSTNTNGYEITDIENIANKITDGDHATPIRSSKGIKLLSARNVKNSFIDFGAGLDYVEEHEFERMVKRCNPECGDILISCSGTIGRVSRVYITEPFVLVRSVALVKLKLERVNPIFMERYLQTLYVQAIMNRSANKSGQANLFNNQIKKIPVMLPPIELQNQFAYQVEKMEQQKQLLEQSLIQLENNFNSLMQRAFKGELF